MGICFRLLACLFGGYLKHFSCVKPQANKSDYFHIHLVPSLRIFRVISPSGVARWYFYLQKHAIDSRLKFILLRALGREIIQSFLLQYTGLDFVNITWNDDTYTPVSNKKKVLVQLRNRVHNNTVRPWTRKEMSPQFERK